MTEHAAGGTARVRELFDAKAATWSLKYEAGGRLASRLAWLVGAMEGRVGPGDRILDLGCATGDLARELAAAGLRVTACDISEQMLARAALADPDRTVEWTALDPGWRLLPLPAGTFGAVVVSSVLEYVDDPKAVLSECARVLQPGGTLLCTVPDVRHPVRWLEWLGQLALHMPLAEVIGRHHPRLDNYLTYLRISRQRHIYRWWNAAAHEASLSDIHMPHASQRWLPLRLLSFQKSEETEEMRTST